MAELGEVVSVGVLFTNTKTGQPVTPDTWRCTVEPPRGSGLAAETVTYPAAGVHITLTQDLDALAAPITGAFTVTLTTERDTLAHVGRWRGRVTSTGTGQAATPWHVVVDPPAVPIVAPTGGGI